ncbi:TPA: TraV family lipoprotein [Klebsiella michiganensis]
MTSNSFCVRLNAQASTPYIDTDDVYHQPSTVLFVVTPSAWGQPRIN